MVQKSSKEILYCRTTCRNQKFAAGHWFFHTGRWAVCAIAERTRNRLWAGNLLWAPLGNEVPDETPTMRSISGVVEFVETFFECSVRKAPADKYLVFAQL